MNGTADAQQGTTFLKKKAGPFTWGQIIGMILGLIIGLFVLNLSGMGRSMIGWLIVGVAVYIIPHLLGLTDPKKKAVYGLVFAVVAILLGGSVIGPSFIDSNSDTSSDSSGAFTSVEYTYDGDEVTVTAAFTSVEDETPVLACAPIDMVSFRSFYITKDLTLTAMTVADGTATVTLTLDSSKLYYLCAVMATTSEDGSYSADPDTASFAVLNGAGFTGSVTDYAYEGAAFCLLYVMAIFYLILVFTTIMRRKITKERAKMEAEGRLYPEGYGRCDKCGAVVLPGEVRCRKCGTYIDRPDSMKPQKKDFFECSECGAEVPADATVCPKCGARFDEPTENEIVHPDGQVDTSDETVPCPKCGENVPKNADFCPKCGYRLR
ncbi:MAG: zinc-ribbon domain-containing protein [Candidatus Methanomethylophilus sp.]|nr:zinc-ribbon domain-containing protein [Methanomethylophilus sp.]MDD4668703.1 zinc-ribbon domain-containing protein [Methanomethylophilus sp.]